MHLPSILLFELPERLGYVGPRFLAVPYCDCPFLYVLCQDRFDVRMLVKYVGVGLSVIVFWWLALAGPSCVGVEPDLSPFKGTVGFRILRKSGGKNEQDAGGGWWNNQDLV